MGGVVASKTYMSWGPVEFFIFGLVCAVPPVVYPVLRPLPEEAHKPLFQRYTTKVSVNCNSSGSV